MSLETYRGATRTKGGQYIFFVMVGGGGVKGAPPLSKIFPKQKCFFKDLKSKKKEILSCCMQIWLCSLNKIKYFFFKTNYSIISTITLGFLIPVINA